MSYGLLLPTVLVTSWDYCRLMLAVAFETECEVADFLLAELRRAKVCEAPQLPSDVVAPGRLVIYQVDGEARPRSHVLVHPDDYRSFEDEVSVMSPVGTALLGLRPGDGMAYIDGGETERVRVVTVCEVAASATAPRSFSLSPTICGRTIH